MVRIAKILCPIDFSDFSRHAFIRALAIARSHQAELTVLHVVPIRPASPVLPYIEPQTLGPFEMTAAEHERIVRELREFLAVDATSGVTVTFEATEAPDVHEEILVHADRLPADLIVLGTHGRSGFERLMLGSVTERVLRKARRPVLTVPAVSPDADATRQGAFDRILCAVDFSDCSMAALGYAASLAEESRARLLALHVIELAPPAYDPLVGPPIDLPGYRQACETAGRERLKNVIPTAMRNSTGIAAGIEELVVCGKPHREILRIAEERRSDLIVLGVHGRNVVDRLLFGSTVEPVVRQAHCPVLTVRPEAPAASAAA
jgi:nucleotide-binding universal stress UspA family protein